MTEQTRGESSARWPLLDGLRGVAILLVVTSHVGILGNGGAVGVTLFFVLSGFLITNLLVDEEKRTGSIRLGRFYFRRAYRLLPALILYLAGAGLIAALYGRSAGWVWDETWPPLFYVTNYAQLLVSELDMNWHTWSLAVEEHFYLIWPLLFLAIPGKYRLRGLGVALAVLVSWSLFALANFPEWGHTSTDANAYALGAGCLVAIARSTSKRFQFPHWAPLLGVIAIVACTGVSVRSVRQPVVVAVAMITVLACTELRDGPLCARPLRFMGKISYGVYLWHVPLLMAAGFALERRVLAAAASVVVAWVSWMAVERPTMARREKDWILLRSRLARRLRRAVAAPDQGISDGAWANQSDPGKVTHPPQAGFPASLMDQT